jgi:hypothetical protein
MLEDRSGDTQLAVWYRSLLKVKMQLTEEALQELASTSELLECHTLVGYPKISSRSKQLMLGPYKICTICP